MLSVSFICCQLLSDAVRVFPMDSFVWPDIQFFFFFVTGTAYYFSLCYFKIFKVIFKYRQLVQLFSNTGSWFGYFQIQAVGSVFSNHQCYFIKNQLFLKTEIYLTILKFIFGNSCIVSVHIFLVSQVSDTDNYSIFWYCYRYLQILSFTILVVLVIFKPF